MSSNYTPMAIETALHKGAIMLQRSKTFFFVALGVAALVWAIKS